VKESIKEQIGFHPMMTEPYFYGAYKALPAESVILNEPPIASFTHVVLSAEGGRPLTTPQVGDRNQFDALASYDLDGTVVQYEWDWNSDGTWDTETTDPVTKHTFMKEGTYQLTPRVTDNDGRTNETTKTTVVEHKDIIQAEFTFQVVDDKLHKVQLDASCSIDTMGTITRYEWDWNGDSVYDTAVDAPGMIHRFDGEGPYQVILAIVDDQGNRASSTNKIELKTGPTEASPEGVAPQQKRQVLRVGTFMDYAPFEYVDEHGHFVGFDVALIEEIAKLSGFEVKWIDLPFEALITNLITGILDVIAAVLSITEDRKVTIAFTEPYWEAPEDPAGPLYGFAVRKTDIDLLTALNSGLEQLGASGRYEQLVERYMK